MSLPTTTTADFQTDVLEADTPVLVDFTAVWCGPCRMVTPVLKQIAAERPDLRVLEINADDNPEIARRYNVLSLPFIALFKDGEFISGTVGARPKSAILSSLDAALAR